MRSASNHSGDAQHHSPSDAGLNKYNTRFDEFWRGSERDFIITGVMRPLDYNSLKTDKAYIYMLKTQLNLMGWIIENPRNYAIEHGTKLLDLINKELERIDN